MEQPITREPLGTHIRIDLIAWLKSQARAEDRSMRAIIERALLSERERLEASA